MQPMHLLFPSSVVLFVFSNAVHLRIDIESGRFFNVFMCSFSYFSCVVSPHLDVFTKKCDTRAVQLRAVAEILPEHQQVKVTTVTTGYKGQKTKRSEKH